MKDNPLIELKGVTKFYSEAGKKRSVFRQLNTAFEGGEFVVLLGRSGSGKSTLLNLISGIDLPSQGDILVDGLNLSRLPENQRTLYRRRHMGFIFQSYNLIPTLSVLENLLLPLELNRITRPSRFERVTSILNSLGLTGRENDYPDRLSGGEQQRVAIARALVHDPALILADEPTGNLDLETGREVLNLLNRFVRDAGKTLIMATHSQEVIGLADRVMTIRGGRLEIASL